MQRPTGLQDGREGGLVERFVASLRELHVEGQVVTDASETTSVLKRLLAKSRTVVLAGIPPRYQEAVRAALGDTRADFLEDLQGRPAAEVVKALDAADTGVTWAVNGVALEGALVEVVYDDTFKLASSLPIVHVALLEASSVVPDLASAMPMVGELVRKAPADRKPVVSFISGASKTGDIEMRLLYGVHGPHTVHVVILDWS